MRFSDSGKIYIYTSLSSMASFLLLFLQIIYHFLALFSFWNSHSPFSSVLQVPSEKAMAPHSSTLAWKIPWMEEPRRLQSMGSLGSDTTEWLHFHFSLSYIGEGNGNPLQCSCLENPRDREPGGLPSIGSHRVGHDWSDLAIAIVTGPLGSIHFSLIFFSVLQIQWFQLFCFQIYRFFCLLKSAFESL